MCVAGSGSSRLDITICSSAIASGLYGHNTLGAIYLARGRARRLGGDCGRAIEDFNEAEQLMPFSAAAPARRGLAKQCEGNLDAAISEFDTALARNPFFPAAWRDRAIAHFFSQSVESAQSDLRHALRIDPYDAEAHTFLALCQFVTGDYDSARINFDKADRLGHAWQYLDLWRLYSRQLSNSSDPQFMQRLSKRASDEQWPAPLLRYFLEPDVSDSDNGTSATPNPIIKDNRLQMEDLFYRLLFDGRIQHSGSVENDGLNALFQYNRLPLSVELTLAAMLSGQQLRPK